MEPRPTTDGPRGVPLESEALLNALRPHCMAVMITLEDILGSERDKVPIRTRAVSYVMELLRGRGRVLSISRV